MVVGVTHGPTVVAIDDLPRVFPLSRQPAYICGKRVAGTFQISPRMARGMKRWRKKPSAHGVRRSVTITHPLALARLHHQKRPVMDSGNPVHGSDRLLRTKERSLQRETPTGGVVTFSVASRAIFFSKPGAGTHSGLCRKSVPAEHTWTKRESCLRSARKPTARGDRKLEATGYGVFNSHANRSLATPKHLLLSSFLLVAVPSPPPMGIRYASSSTTSKVSYRNREGSHGHPLRRAD